MTSQLERDWEEQQHGLQGTITGSAHNQIGLDSRMPPPSSPTYDSGRQTRNAQTPKATAARKQQSTPAGEFNIPTALLGFAGACYWIYEPAQASPWPMLIGAGIAAALAGRFYKPIWGLVLAAGILYALGLYSG